VQVRVLGHGGLVGDVLALADGGGAGGDGDGEGAAVVGEDGGFGAGGEVVGVVWGELGAEELGGAVEGVVDGGGGSAREQLDGEGGVPGDFEAPFAAGEWMIWRAMGVGRGWEEGAARPRPGRRDMFR